jgi:hypothetical protein
LIRKALLFCFLFPFGLVGQILINEIGSANVNNIADEDGDFEDWIELYNPTSSAIDMKDYYFNYNDGKFRTWKFPSIIIPANGRLVVFASGKDRRTVIHHWEVPIYHQITWRYFVGTSEPDSNWRYPFFNDGAWQTGPGGIGYGDGDDSTIISPTTSLYMRKVFWIPDTSKIGLAVCLLDFDDGVVVYLNGKELGRYNVGIQGVPPLHTDLAYDEHEAQLYQNGNLSAGFFVDKQTLSNALLPGLNVFGIQTHNVSATSDDLSCIPYFLTGKTDTTIDYFPLAANFSLHTNFTLASNGFTLSLHNPSGGLSDLVYGYPLQTDHSRGRKSDGAPEWVIFETPTPNDPNQTAPWYTSYAGVPTFEKPAGFYQGNQSISISGLPQTVIRFTIDGSIPTTASPLYTGPVFIDSSRVIRARLFSTNPQILPGKTITNTYFINENITLPVVSLASDPKNLFDWNTGIYVMGPNASPNFPYYGANFWQGWEKPGHTEFFEKGGKRGFYLDNILKIHGNWSKGFPQRSFRVQANDDYGQSMINYKIFPQKDIESFKAFNLRNAGIDWNTTHMRDGLMHRAVRNTNADIMDHYPVVVFVNGRYFGVYEMRERQDEYYLAENHKVDKDKVDLLRFFGDVMAGSNKDFLSMVRYIATNDMSVQTKYDTVKNHLLDISNICDYFGTEIYYSNPDWLVNNIKFWRVNNPPGKWRYILWDLDGGLGLFSTPSTNLIPYITNSDTVSMYYGNPHSFMMQSLFRNIEFRHYFINRYADLINTTFHPNNLGRLALSIHDEMLPEMARHFGKWGIPNSNPFGMGSSLNVPMWENAFDSLMFFISVRPLFARYFVIQEWNLNGTVDVTLDVFPPGAGYIKMNTIVPDSLPWTGVYFDGVPVTMTAVANPGYVFKEWTSPNLVQNPHRQNSLTLNVNQNEPFTAYFREIDNSLSVYPNPSDGIFNILVKLPEDGQVKVQVSDLVGKVIAVLHSDDKVSPFGEILLKFDAESMALRAGVYLVSAIGPEGIKTQKIIYSGKPN